MDRNLLAPTSLARMCLSIMLSGIWQKQIYKGLFGSEWGELVYLNVGQNIPMQFPGLTLNLFANKSRVVPGYTLQSNDIKSRSTVLSAGLTQSVVRSRRLNFDLLTSLESRSSATKLLGDILTEDRLTILTMGGKLQMADSRGAVNSVNLTVRQGLNLMGARDTGSLNLSRLEGRSDFTSVQMQAARTQNLTNDLSVFGQIRGQYAFNPLLSSEEFGYGGNTIGRAFNASEIVGDHGVSGTVESRVVLPLLYSHSN
jgi:hemolysin activation/secretion protein